jgi:hypothetical protein
LRIYQQRGIAMWIKTAEGWRRLEPKALGLSPRSGIFRPQQAWVTEWQNGNRALGYEVNVSKYIHEEISLEEIYRCWDKAIEGAFGETLK